MVAPYVPIQNVVPWNQFIAGLNQFVYSTNWTANVASDVLVYSRAPNIPTVDAAQLVDPSNYTVQFIGASNVVQVTFNALQNPPQYNIVTIMRATPSDFLNLYTNTNFAPSMLNSDFENLVLVDQQNQLYWQQIVPRYNNSATVNVPIDTILPILGANQFWIKNASNTAFEAATLGSGGEFPVLGPFILYVSDSNYPNGFSLGSLSSGILAQNVSLGVSTPYSIPLPIAVPDGGTGLSSITPFAILLGGTTNTSPIAPLADLGDAGQVLTSSGPGLPPSFQTSPSNSGVPVGTIIDYAGTDLPSLYLVCDGSAINRVTYSSLFSVLGVTWGSGDGSTTFNLPNLQGFVTAGSGGTLPPLSNTVASNGGAATVTLTQSNMPTGVPINSGGSLSSVCFKATGTNVPSNDSNPYSQGSGSSVSIVQPTVIVQKLIKYA